MSRIVGLQAENVKRLKAIELHPNGSLVVVKGRNGQGKTSLLDAIQMALGGKGAQPAEPIRRGADSAQVVLDLEDMTVERRWTKKGTYLEVRAKDGSKLASPQAVLDKLVGSLSFDPLTFLRLKPAEQLALLRDLVGVNTSDLDAESKRIYDERTIVNREVERLKAQMPEAVNPNVPDEPVSLEALIEEQKTLLAKKPANDSMREEHRRAQEASSVAKKSLERAKAKLDQLLAEAEKARRGLAEAEAELAMTEDLSAELMGEVSNLVDPDLSAVTEKMRALQATNALVQQKHRRRNLAEQIEAKKRESDGLSSQLEGLAAEKEMRITSAKMPVPGLGFSDEGITYNGMAFSQASGAEQLRVSLAMGLASNPKLKVLLIRDGSLLDSESMRLVAEMAAQADAQVWIEVVGTGGPAGVVIEDGEVSEVQPEPKVIEAAGGKVRITEE